MAFALPAAASAIAAAAPAVAATAAKVSFMTVAKSVLMNVAISAAMSALQPQVGSAGKTFEWTLDPNAPIPFAAGRVGVAGTVAHLETFGPDKMYYGFVSVLSGAGPIKSVQGFKGDDEAVAFNGDGKAVSSQWANEMWFRSRLGTQPDTALTSPPGLKSGATLPNWTANHKLSGKASYMLVLGENSKRTAYPTGEPKPLVTIEGLFGWDPRQDSTYPGGFGPCRLDDPATWVWLDCPILWGLKWALGLWEGPTGKGAPGVDYQVGGIGANVDGIDVAAFVAAANVAQANDWKVAAYPTTDDDKAQVLDGFLQAGGAIYSQRAGKISCIQRAAPRASIVTITAADTAGPLEIDTAASRIDRINTIRPRFWSEAHRWQMTAIDDVTDDTYKTQDGGTRPRGIDFPFSPLATQTAQLSALQIAHTREGIAGTIPLKPHLKNIAPGTAFTISEPGFLLDGVKCLCLNAEYDAASGIVSVTFVTETDAKYPYALGQSPIVPAPPVLTAPDLTVTPPAVGEWTLAAATFSHDGVSVPALLFTGAVDNARTQTVIFEFRPVGAADWSGAGVEDQTVTRKEGAGGLLTPGVQYEGAVSYRVGGNISERLVLGPVTAGTLIAGDVSPNSPAMLEIFYRQIDEVLASTLRIVDEQERRASDTTDTQRFIDRIGVVNPATGRVELRAENLFAGRLNMATVDERVAEGFDDGGLIRQPIPRDVSFLSGVHNEQTGVSPDGQLYTEGPGGPIVLGQVVRVAEATANLGHDAVVRRGIGDQGGRQFLEKPLTNTILSGDLAVDVYQSSLRIFDATNLYGVTLPISAFQPSIGGRLVVSTAAGVVAGDVASTTALRAPYARIGNDPTKGFLTLNEGDATRPGYMAFHTADLTRRGYVGFSDAVSKLILSGENGYNWAFDQRVDMLAGAAVTGPLTVSGLATLSGGAAVTGDITSTAAIHAASFVRVRTGSGGYIQHTPGDATYTGYTEYYNAAGTRLGYTGLGSGGTLVMAAEGAVTWAFDKQLRMLAGAAITGATSILGGSLLVNTAGGAGTSAGRHINLGSVTSPTDWRTYDGSTTAALQMENSSTEGFVLVATQGASVPRTQLITTGGFQLNVGATIGGFGTNAFQVLANGKAGFGTSAPGSKVQISDGNSDYVASTAAFSVRKLEEGYGLNIGNASSGNSWLQAGYASGFLNYDLILQPNGGKVGVNTPSPEVALHVAGGIRARNGSVGFIGLESGDATNTGYLAFNNAAGTRYGYIGLVNTTAKVIDFRAENSAVFQFTGGAVTIDNSLTVTNSITTSAGAGGLLTLGHYSGGYPWTLIRPDAASTGFEFRTNAGDPLLSLNQSTRLATFGGNIDTIAGVNCKLTLRSATNYNWVLQAVGDDLKILEAGSISRVHIKYPSGFFGIDCDPASKFQVRAATNENFAIGGHQTLSAGPIINIYNDAVSANVPLELRASQFLFDTGKVGINTGSSALTERLTVNGDTKIIGELMVFDATAGFVKFSPNAFAKPALYALTNVGGASDLLLNPVGGNIGICLTTAPTERLHLNGRVMVTGSGYTANPVGGVLGYYSSTVPQTYIQAPSGGEVVVWDGPTNQLAVFRPDGKFGVGIAAPLDRAHIHGGGLIVSGSSETITGPTSYTSLTGKMLQASYDATNDKAVIRSVYWGSNFTPLYFQGSEFRWATGSGSITERMILDVNGKLTINGTIARAGADHHFAVDTGCGFYFDVNGSPVALLEANGRLSLNALNIGGNSVGVTTAYVPTVGVESGTVTASVTEASYTRVGSQVFADVLINVSALTGGGNYATITLPFTAAKYAVGHGLNVTTAQGLTIEVLGGSNVAKVRRTSNAFPFAVGDDVQLSIAFKV